MCSYITANILSATTFFANVSRAQLMVGIFNKLSIGTLSAYMNLPCRSTVVVRSDVYSQVGS